MSTPLTSVGLFLLDAPHSLTSDVASTTVSTAFGLSGNRYLWSFDALQTALDNNLQVAEMLWLIRQLQVQQYVTYNWPNG